MCLKPSSVNENFVLFFQISLTLYTTTTKISCSSRYIYVEITVQSNLSHNKKMNVNDHLKGQEWWLQTETENHQMEIGLH